MFQIEHFRVLYAKRTDEWKKEQNKEYILQNYGRVLSFIK